MMCAHVDDLIVTGPEEVLQLIDEMGKVFLLKHTATLKPGSSENVQPTRMENFVEQAQKLV
jgi:hypothetical protein